MYKRPLDIFACPYQTKRNRRTHKYFISKQVKCVLLTTSLQIFKLRVYFEKLAGLGVIVGLGGQGELGGGWGGWPSWDG